MLDILSILTITASVASLPNKMLRIILFSRIDVPIVKPYWLRVQGSQSALLVSDHIVMTQVLHILIVIINTSDL